MFWKEDGKWKNRYYIATLSDPLNRHILNCEFSLL